VFAGQGLHQAGLLLLPLLFLCLCALLCLVCVHLCGCSGRRRSACVLLRTKRKDILYSLLPPLRLHTLPPLALSACVATPPRGGVALRDTTLLLRCAARLKQNPNNIYILIFVEAVCQHAYKYNYFNYPPAATARLASTSTHSATRRSRADPLVFICFYFRACINIAHLSFLRRALKRRRVVHGHLTPYALPQAAQESVTKKTKGFGC
jgi:hypothetical protein